GRRRAEGVRSASRRGVVRGRGTGRREQEGLGRRRALMSGPGKLVIGTRGSALARWQAAYVGRALQAAHAGLEIEEKIIVTEGDRVQTGPVIDLGGKGVWVKEIEDALLSGAIDLAVH